MKYTKEKIEQFLNSQPTLPSWEDSTYKDWLLDVLLAVPTSGDGFGSKRANCGTSGWQHDLWVDLGIIEPAIIESWYFDEYEQKNVATKVNEKLAKEVYREVLKYVFVIKLADTTELNKPTKGEHMLNITVDFQLNDAEMRETFAATRIDTSENYRREIADHWDVKLEEIKIIDIQVEEVENI